MTAEMAINNAPIDGTKYSPYELNMGYTTCLAPDTYWEANDRPGQSHAAKVWYKQMMRECEHARLALQSIKDNEIGRANRRREETTFQFGDLVLVRVFTVNRTQMNEGGAFANRWAGPYKVIEQVAHQSYRLELSVRASSRMGRVFNAIELKPY